MRENCVCIWQPIFYILLTLQNQGPGGLQNGLNRVCDEAVTAAENNYQMIVLSDRLAGQERWVTLLVF